MELPTTNGAGERKTRQWIFVTLGFVVAIGLLSAWLGPRFYSRWQQRRLLGQAHQLLQEGDPQRAALCLRRVLELNWSNVEATRTMAEVAESFVPLEAVALRERVCQLVPSSYDDATAWALAALRFGQTGQAEEAFELMKKTGPPGARHHAIGARIALAAGRVSAARAQFAEALRIDPENEDYQLELAAIEIRSPEAALRRQARATLERLQASPKLRHAALHAVIEDQIAQNRIFTASSVAREFVKDPDATFEDRLQYLGILRIMDDPTAGFTFLKDVRFSFGMLKDALDPSFTAYLSELEEQAGGHPQYVADLVSWMNARDLSLVACEWTSWMPRASISIPPIAPNLAESYRLVLHWDRLQAFIASANWENFEFLRLAFLARLMRERGDAQGAIVQWASAVKLTEYRPEKLGMLERAASAWGWDGERETLLWDTARTSKRPRPALEALAEYYRSRRNTQKAFNVWARILELEPSDVTARKNWARLSLLMDHDRFRAGQVAQELYEQNPADPEIVATYAFVEHLRLHDGQALALMQRLPPEQLEVPAVAAYYGIVLAANKKKEDAARFLDRARQAVLLREEQDLVDQARRSLD